MTTCWAAPLRMPRSRPAFTGRQFGRRGGAGFPPQHKQLFADHKIDLTGLEEVADGDTFTWTGEYEVNMNNRKTLAIALNVFEKFEPKLPESPTAKRPTSCLATSRRRSSAWFANKSAKPKFVVADTMDLWIGMARADLLALLKEVDMLILNDSEARAAHRGRQPHSSRARRSSPLGPKLRCGQEGRARLSALWASNGEFFSTGAFPLESDQGSPRAQAIASRAASSAISRARTIFPSPISRKP